MNCLCSLQQRTNTNWSSESATSTNFVPLITKYGSNITSWRCGNFAVFRPTLQSYLIPRCGDVRYGGGHSAWHFCWTGLSCDRFILTPHEHGNIVQCIHEPYCTAGQWHRLLYCLIAVYAVVYTLCILIRTCTVCRNLRMVVGFLWALPTGVMKYSWVQCTCKIGYQSNK